MSAAVASSPRNPRAENLLTLRDQIKSSDLKTVLPRHIPVERFTRVVDTAVQQNPKILDASPRSVFQACMKAASDGLLPDGREGAIVPFKDWKASKAAGRDVIDVQWMPMISGVLKKIRNSGQVSTITAQVVYANDKFRYWIDSDGEHLEYEPADDPDTDHIRCVFAFAKMKDGEIKVERMSAAQIEKVRSVSRSKDDGPWKEWYEEMAKKTVVRRIAKFLPSSTDLDDLIRRDDALYDFDGASDKALALPPSADRSLAGRMDALAAPRQVLSGPAAPVAMNDHIEHDPDTGEITQPEPTPAASSQQKAASSPSADEGRIQRAPKVEGESTPRPEPAKPAASAVLKTAVDAFARAQSEEEVDDTDLTYLNSIDASDKPAYDAAYKAAIARVRGETAATDEPPLRPDDYVRWYEAKVGTIAGSADDLTMWHRQGRSHRNKVPLSPEQQDQIKAAYDAALAAKTGGAA